MKLFRRFDTLKGIDPRLTLTSWSSPRVTDAITTSFLRGLAVQLSAQLQRRMPQLPSPSQLSTLPDNAWIRILSLIEEPILWIVCRRVSHDFRCYIDRIFINYLLPKTSIDYDTGLYCTVPSGQHLALFFQFMGLSDDQTRAYFKDPRNDRDFPSGAGPARVVRQ